MKEKLEELIQHHKHAKQEAWELAQELYRTDETKLSEDDLKVLEAAKRDMNSEYSMRCLFVSELEDLRDE